MSLAFLVLMVRAVVPAWSAYDIHPLHALARRALPALQRGEPMVLYHFRHGRPSVRFIRGHPALVRAAAEPADLRQVLQGANRGTILTGRETSLPALPGTVRETAAAGQWALWQYTRAASREPGGSE